MPFRPDVADVHTDRPLSNMSIAYIQSEKNFVASQLTTAIQVENQTNTYATYTKEDFFRDEAKRRAPATETAGSGFRVSTSAYRCEEYGFHKDIPDEVRNNADAPFRVDNDARVFVNHKMLLKKDVLLAADIFATGKWATDVVGGTDFNQWDDWGSSNPIMDVEDGRDAIHSVTAYDPNSMLLGRQVWRQLKHHPTMIELIKYTSKGVLTQDLVASLLELDKLVIGQSLKATNVEGATAAYAYNYGKDALLMYQVAKPGLLAPTAFLSFIWARQGRTVTIRRLRNEWKRFTRIEGYFNIDHVICCTDLGYFMDAVVA